MWKGRKPRCIVGRLCWGRKEGRKEKRTEEGKEYLDSKDKGSLCLRTAIFSVERGKVHLDMRGAEAGLRA